MPVSIKRKQRSLLDSGWLDDVGTTAPTNPIELPGTEEKLVDLAITFKTVAENELSKRDAVNTGRLADSIQLTEVVLTAGVYSIDIRVLNYYAWVNKGVKGTQNKSIDTPFAFKNNRVGKAFMLSIRKWMIREGLKAKAKEVKRKPIGQEKKGVRFENTSNAMAYAIATSIKKKGIEPTGFWDKAGNAARRQAGKTLGGTLAIDIVNAIMK